MYPFENKDYYERNFSVSINADQAQTLLILCTSTRLDYGLFFLHYLVRCSLRRAYL